MISSGVLVWSLMQMASSYSIIIRFCFTDIAGIAKFIKFFFLSTDSLTIDGVRCMITPNKMEFDRLVNAVSESLRKDEAAHSPTVQAILKELSVEDEVVKTRALSLALGGLTVYRKGEVDLITSGGDIYAINEKGSPRRCGGQGDILAGSLAVAFFWASKVSR